jgi:hypothetical protein
MLSDLIQSWPSFVVAISATVGYVLVGRKSAIGWLFNCVANLALVLTGLLAHEWGLLQSSMFAGLAIWNYFAWRRNPPVTVDERRRLAELEQENRELRRANEVLRTAAH